MDVSRTGERGNTDWDQVSEAAVLQQYLYGAHMKDRRSKFLQKTLFLKHTEPVVFLQIALIKMSHIENSRLPELGCDSNQADEGSRQQ